MASRGFKVVDRGGEGGLLYRSIFLSRVPYMPKISSPTTGGDGMSLGACHIMDQPICPGRTNQSARGDMR